MISLEKWYVNEKEYEIVRLLGKGKGGYSYLVTDGTREYVLKQIHHEPCDYYTFGDKLESELRDYRRLREIGITMPELLDVDRQRERILKEYIQGETIDRLIISDRMRDTYYHQVKGMCQKLYAAHTNIDYYPTNFVVRDEVLYYIDFECNDYMEQWDFDHWGNQYWWKSPEFLKAFPI